MHQSKLIRLLSTLNRKEMTHFREYVHSPFFNKHQSVRTLIDIIDKAYPKLTSKSLLKENLFSALFPDLPAYNDAKLAHVMNYLMKLFEGFLAHNEMATEPFLQHRYLARSLRKKGASKTYEAHTKKWIRDVNKSPLRNTQFYYYQFKLQEELYQYHLIANERALEQQLQKRMDFLDEYYLASKMKTFCEMINRSKIVNKQYDLSLQNEIIEYIDKNWEELDGNVAIAIYYKVYKTLMEPEVEKHYKEFYDLLTNSTSSFSISELTDLFGFAQNYCIKKANTGQISYYSDLFNVYKLLIQNNLVLEGSHVNSGRFKNIVTVGCRLNEFEWTEKFINEYRKYLKEDEQEAVYNYNMATLCFGKNDYQHAMTLLHLVDFQEIHYIIGSKALLLKIYYELNESMPFDSLTDSFKIYMRRNKNISEYIRETRTLFISITKRLYNVKINLDYKSKESSMNDLMKVKRELEGDIKVMNKDWLLEKLQEMEQKLTPTN